MYAAISRRKRKGFAELTMSPLVKIFMFVITFAVAGGILITASGGLGGLMDGMCKAIPGLCTPKEASSGDEMVARTSASALTHAINCIVAGGDDCGEKVFDSRTVAGSGSTPGSFLTGQAVETSEGYVPEHSTNVTCSLAEDGSYSKCMIENFQLPQKVTSAEEYITNFGDPQYLVYWNKFPIEENTWTFKTDWKVYAAIGLISVLPIGRVAGKTVKTAWYAWGKTWTKGMLKETMEKVMEETGEEFTEEIFKKSMKEVSEEFGKLGGRRYLKNTFVKVIEDWSEEAAEKGGKKLLIKEYIKENLRDIIQKRLTKKGVTSIAIKGTALTGTALLAEILDSVSENYVSHGNNMVLKSPFEDARLFQLDGSWKGKPIVIAWEPRSQFVTGIFGANNYENAHLVSPCYLDNFEIIKNDVKCSIYSYNDREQISECSSPEPIKEKDLDDYPVCGIVDENIDSYLEMEGDRSIFSRLNTILDAESGRKFFEYDKDGDLVKMYVPWLSSDSETVYVDNFVDGSETVDMDVLKTGSSAGTRISTYIPGSGETKTFNFKTMTGDVNYGDRDKSMVIVESDDDVIMEAGEKYVIRAYECSEKDEDIVIDIYPYDCEDGEVFLSGKCGIEMISCEKARSQSQRGLQIDTLDDLKYVFLYSLTIGNPDIAEDIVSYTPDREIRPSDLMLEGKTFGNSELYQLYVKETTLMNMVTWVHGYPKNDCGSGNNDNQCFRVLETPKMKLRSADDNLYSTAPDYFSVTGIGTDSFVPNKLTINQSIMGTGFEWQEIELKKESDEMNYDYITFYDTDMKSYGDMRGISYDDYEEIEVRTSKVSLSEIINPKGNDHILTISDITDNNDYSVNQISMTHCRTEGVILDLTDIDKQKTDQEDGQPNYCLRQLSKTESWLKFGADAATVVLGVLAARFTGGWSLLVITGAAGAEVGIEMMSDYKQSWPSPEFWGIG